MKIYIAILLTLSLLLISGATGCPSTGTSADAASGLGVSFVNEAPPLSVSVNQEFPIYVDILNNGGQFVNKGEAKFYLSGVGPNLEGVTASQSNDRSLSKQSISPDRVVFADKAKFTFPIESLYTLPIVLTSCYSYGTTAQASLCISAKNDSEVCDLAGEKITATSNSIAPIQISSVKEELAGNKLRVLITLSNKLGGQVYLPDADCDKLQAKDISESFKQDKVGVEVRLPDREKSSFICKLLTNTSPYVPQDSLAGSANMGTVVCERTLAGGESYQTPFAVILRYKYVESISKNINILP